MSSTMTTRTCEFCKKEFQARTADVKRGWAKFCSKSCKAQKQEARTGQHRAHMERRGDENQRMHDQAMHDATGGWDEGGWLNC